MSEQSNKPSSPVAHPVGGNERQGGVGVAQEQDKPRQQNRPGERSRQSNRAQPTPTQAGERGASESKRGMGPRLREDDVSNIVGSNTVIPAQAGTHIIFAAPINRRFPSQPPSKTR